MYNKHIITIISGCIVCILCGFALGFMSGSGMLHGDRLAGTGMDDTILQGMDRLRHEHNSKMKEMQGMISDIDEAREMLDLCRNMRSSGEAPPNELQDFCNNAGITMPSGTEYSPDDWDKLANEISYYISSRNAMTTQDIMRLQYELMQLNLQTEVTTKAADKSSQGVQTLFKGQ